VISIAFLHSIMQTCGQDYIILTAPLDVILSQTEVRQPDLIIIHRDRKSIITKRGIEGIPDIVVEILSPSTRKRDKRDKTRAYAQYCVPEYWIVDPEAYTLEQHLLQEAGRYELAEFYEADEPIVSPHLTCLSFTMNDIAAEVKGVLDWA
jgi:Uma2 family endonuclease